MLIYNVRVVCHLSNNCLICFI